MNNVIEQQPNIGIGALTADLKLSPQPKFQHIYTTKFKHGPFLPQNQYSVAYQAIGPCIFNNTPIYTGAATPMYPFSPPTVGHDLHDQQVDQGYIQDQNYCNDAFANMLIAFHGNI